MPKTRTETHYCGACREWEITVADGQARKALEALDEHIWNCPAYRAGRNGGG